MTAARRIPALIVSGFLGSGKTTLVRHLLADAQRQGIRVAVVSNELGELGIDQALLGQRDEDYVELTGGCVCCRLSDELVDTLQMLWERAQPDRIIVETSGVALPFETQLNFWREPVASFIEDDVALVVVNAEQLAQGRDLDDTFEQQVSSADLLVLNKIDLVPGESLPALEARLREIEPDAPIARARHGALPPDLVFPPDPEGLRARRRATAPEPAPHRHERFETEELRVEPGIESEVLLARIRARAPLRAKGFVATQDGVRLLQGVGPRLELLEPPDPPRPELIGRLVLITRA